MNPPQADGQITTTVLATPLLTPGVTAAAVPFQVTYAGAAPDIVAGGIQVNVLLAGQPADGVLLAGIAGGGRHFGSGDRGDAGQAVTYVTSPAGRSAGTSAGNQL